MHEIIPFLEFINQLAQMHHGARRAILEARFLEVLVQVNKHCDCVHNPEVIAMCNDTLKIFLADGRLDTVCSLSRMDLVWPRLTDAIPLTAKSLSLVDYTPRQRRNIVRAMDLALVQERICEIEVILSMLSQYQDAEKDLFDVCLDLLEFSSVFPLIHYMRLI
jgi:hypothetical protein